MSIAPGPFPRRITAGGQCGELELSGSLVIAPGAVTWVFNRNGVHRLVWWFSAHTPLPPNVIRAELPIIVLRSRFAPPGLNRILVLCGEGATVAVQAWSGRWPRIRDALEAAAIPTVERTVLFSTGSRQARGGNPNARAATYGRSVTRADPPGDRQRQCKSAGCVRAPD